MKASSKLDRIFWIIVIIASFVVGIVLVTLLWSWNTNDATISIVETTTYNTRNVRFPAITICDFNAISKKKSLQLASKLIRPKDMTVEQVAELFLLTINENYKSTSKYPEKETIKQLLINNSLNVGSLLKSIQPDCKEMFVFCLWEGQTENCNNLFQPISFQTNICCVTNFFGVRTKIEMIIAKKVVKKPINSYGVGYGYGLTLGLRSDINDYYGTTSINSRGFTVHIHDAFTYPRADITSMAAVYRRENFIHVTPTTLYTTEKAAAISPKKRNCLLPHEQKMIFNKYYTLNNCLFECETFWRIRTCGCIFPLFLRQPARSNCTMEQYWCLLRLLTFEDVDGLDDIPKSSYCNCLPECTKNDYNVYMTAGRFIGKVKYTSQEKQQMETPFNTIIHVFLGNVMGTRIRRDISEDWFITLC